MRSIWFLILLGSLITYHCFTTVSGEKAKDSREASQPDLAQKCKPYVDAALKTSQSDEGSEEGTTGEDDGDPPDSQETGKARVKKWITVEVESEEDATEEDPDATEEDPNATEEDDATEEDSATEEDPNATEEDPNATEEDDDTEEDSATEEDPNATEEDPNATEEDDTREDSATEEDPNATEEDPNATEEDDDTEEDSATEEDPNATEEDPNATEEDDDTEEDSATEEDPNATEEDPNATEEDDTREDSATEEDPNATEEDPNATEEDDDTEEDSATEEDPNATEEDPNATEEDDTREDSATEEDPNATEEDSNATEEDDTREDDATEEDPNATEEDPNATEEDVSESDEDDATEEDPNATEEDPNATEEDDTREDDATEEDPNATEEDPNATEEDESASATEEDPNATEEDPNATEEDDATEEDPNATEEDPNATEEDESAERAGGEEASDEDDGGKSEEDDQSADGDTGEDSGEKAKQDRSVSSDVADETDEPKSGETEETEETQEDQDTAEDTAEDDAVSDEDDEDSEEEEEVEPYEPRSRDHITNILGLDDSEETHSISSHLDKVTQSTLKELRNTYENSVKPLEVLYKYRDLSNRHFGDPEIFSKPLIVFMGPWSGGKSTIINWLLGIQHDDIALRTGADPSPAQFNIMMYGDEPEKLDGTQLAADWTFSGLQKFGQSFLDRLRGQKLPNRLLEKVNIVEIPGILEVRKQVERSFPFNDACQWFIDRADTLFLIYDPAKLDIGPETEAILDQLKGRESQVRIVLNKADTVKPDELLRVQAMLVWNISPLMSSAEPPVMYAASLWDRPLQVESPKSLLIAHENNFLKDIRDGIERRVETRIAAARRFAVRVRNHAKMVDCYLNTYNNHRSFFSDKKKISTDIIDHPQNYHIYEGLSTLTNISRYDLPDPDTYRDFFRLNPLWNLPTLSSTCSFFKGCPLHKLDIAIAYELPETLGKFRRQREAVLSAKGKGSSKH